MRAKKIAESKVGFAAENKQKSEEFLMDCCCRFGFPKDVTPVTRLEFEKVWVGPGEDDTMDPLELLQILEKDWEEKVKEYPAAQQPFLIRKWRRDFLQSTKCKVLYRRGPDDQWTNPFNTLIIRAWSANMDLQWITNM